MKQLSGGESLDSYTLKVAVVAPEGTVQLQYQSQYIHIVGIPLGNLSLCLLKMRFIRLPRVGL